jgi:DNA-binding NtrC family response regulator
MAGEPAKTRVLVVDDEAELRSALCETLAAEGFLATPAEDAAAALALLRSEPTDILLTDLMMPDTDGIELLTQALALDPTLVGIVMTGQGSIQTAVEAMKRGAFDYLLKPFKRAQLVPVLRRAAELHRLRIENDRLRQHVRRLNFESPRFRMIGAGPAMRKLFALIEKVAPTDTTVLIRGASGSGKELVARALHENSARRERPFVAVNCAALQETLLESELFGHEKGSFTGAVAAKRGLIEVAEGGTLFIDEVAEMPAAMQAKLLRVLEDRTFRRVGGVKELAADVRVVAATNKPLEDELKAGRFREDLFYRLNVFAIVAPDLRDRREDLPALTQHLLSTRPLGGIVRTISAAASAALERYDWPGNVRELANVLERAQILAEGSEIGLDDLPESFAHGPDLGAPRSPAAGPLDLHESERRHVVEAMHAEHGNKAHAAKALGISRRALYRLLEKHGLAPSAPSPSADPEG